MTYYIVLISALLVAASAVPISRQLGGFSGDVQVLTVNGTEKCQVDGRLYEIDDDLPTDDPCEYCTCQPPGFACQVVKCEHKPECRSLQRSGLCCPEYICDCEFEGKIYQNGDRITDNENKCEDCYCVTGEVVCSVIQCASPPPNCEIIQDESRCCASFNCSDQVQEPNTTLLEKDSKTEDPERVFDESYAATEVYEQDTTSAADEKSEQPLSVIRDEEAANLNVIDQATDKPEESISIGATDLDAKENEYWLSQLKASSGSQKKEPASAAPEGQSQTNIAASLVGQFKDEETTQKGDIIRVEHVTDVNFNDIELTGAVKGVEVDQLLTKVSSEDQQTANENAETTEAIETRTEGYNNVESFDENAEFTVTERSVVEEAETQGPDSSEEETDVVSKIAKIKFNVEELIQLKDSSDSVTDQTIETRTEKLSELLVSDENTEFAATERSVDDESDMLLTVSSVDDSEMNLEAAEQSETRNESPEQFSATLTPEIETRTEKLPELQAFEEDLEFTATERSFGDEATDIPEALRDVVSKISKINFNVEELIKAQEDAVSNSDTTEIIDTTDKFPEHETFGDSLNQDEDVKSEKDSVIITTPSIETRTDEQPEREAFEENVEFTATERSADEESIMTSTDNPEGNAEIVNKISKISFNVEEFIKSKDDATFSETTEIIETRTDKPAELEAFDESLEFSVTERDAEEESNYLATESPLVNLMDINKESENIFNDVETSGIENDNAETEGATTPVIETRTDKLSDLKAFDEVMEFDVTERVSDDDSSMIFTKSPAEDLEEVNKISKIIFNVEELIKTKDTNAISNSETMESVETRTDENENAENAATEESVDEGILAFTRSPGEQEPEILSRISSKFTDEEKSTFVQDTTDVIETRTEKLDALDDLKSEVMEFGIAEVREESDKVANNLRNQNETDSPAQIPSSEVTASSKNSQESKVEDKNDYWINMADKKEEINSNVVPEVPIADSIKSTMEETFVEVATSHNVAAERVEESVTQEASQSNDIIPENEAAFTVESVAATQAGEQLGNAVAQDSKDLELDVSGADQAIPEADQKVNLENIEAAVAQPSEAEEKMENVDSQEDAAVTEDPGSTPKKQRIEMQIKHLSKKFGLRPLTRRTFSNDIEERRKTRLRDRKMILNRNRLNIFH